MCWTMTGQAEIIKYRSHFGNFEFILNDRANPQLPAGPALIKWHSLGGNKMYKLLIVLAIGLAVTGIFGLGQASIGVGILAIACLVGILARIAQAEAHQDEIKKLLQKVLKEKAAG
jgi:hypothetical protein